MKIVARSLFGLFLLASLGATLADAQFTNTPFQHVIIVVQENRTPDNLFGSDVFDPHGRRLPNAHLATSGSCHSTPITLTPWRLDACFDPDHGHGQHSRKSWFNMYDNGYMDGACDVYVHPDECTDSTPPGTIL